MLRKQVQPKFQPQITAKAMKIENKEDIEVRNRAKAMEKVE